MGFFTASRLNKMKTCFRNGDYEKAIALADKINPTEIRTAYDLSMMADIYMAAKRYGAARRVFAEIYKRNKTVRVCKQLISLNIKLKNVRQAIVYLKELNALDNEDYERFIFQYQIGKMLNQPDEYLIECLKKVREADYIDKWALELAKLFYKTGRFAECIKECQNIKLWFPDTDFSAKADILIGACRSGVSYEESVESMRAQKAERLAKEAAEKQEPAEASNNGADDAYEDGNSEYDGEDAGFDGQPDDGDEFEEEAENGYDEKLETEDGEDYEYAEPDDEEDYAYAEPDDEEDYVYAEPDDEEDYAYAVSDDGESVYFDSEEDERDEAEESGNVNGGKASESFDGFGSIERLEKSAEGKKYGSGTFDDRSYGRRKYDSAAMTEISADDAAEISAASEYAPEEIEERLRRQSYENENDVSMELSDSIKTIMQEDAADRNAEDINDDIATTLINDSLTGEVISALLEQEKNGISKDHDAVDESILKMIDEEE